MNDSPTASGVGGRWSAAVVAGAWRFLHCAMSGQRACLRRPRGVVYCTNGPGVQGRVQLYSKCCRLSISIHTLQVTLKYRPVICRLLFSLQTPPISNQQFPHQPDQTTTPSQSPHAPGLFAFGHCSTWHAQIAMSHNQAQLAFHLAPGQMSGSSRQSSANTCPKVT